MKKKRLFILTALALTVCLLFTLFAVACDNDTNGDDNPTDPSDLLFTNGTFTGVADDSALPAPISWTGAAGSTSSSSATPSGESNLLSGVVDTSTSAWRDLRKKYSDIDIATPGKGSSSKDNEDLDDDKILMIYNKVETSYNYTSTSHTLEINSYYKLSIDVKTMLADDNTDERAGAYISVGSGAEAAWEAIDTKGEWVTYTLYIESSELSTGTI